MSAHNVLPVGGARSQETTGEATEATGRVPEWSSWQRERLSSLQSAFGGSGVLGRQALLDSLNAAIREATASGRPAAAILVDLNNFLGINAAWGPSTGDEVLAEVGARIAAFARDELVRGASGAETRVGRLDGDHFIIVAPGVASYGKIVEATAQLVKSLAQPIDLAGQPIAVSARAAIVQLPEHGRSVTTVLGRGFRLLNTAARARANAVALSETDSQPGLSMVMLERDLASALTSDQLFIALQPKFELSTGKLKGAEALVRWKHPERGMLPPPFFIQAAEKSGLIFDLGLRILRDSCRASNMLVEGDTPLSVAVNVSPLQLGHPDFLSRFLEVIDQEGAAPETLEIEVTETAAMMGGVGLTESLQALRRCGIGIAIDDFGTGFSNLAALSALPADTLKIDRSLVIGVGEGGKAEALLDVAVQLGRTFGLSTVAEGVETTQQYDHVSALGFDLVQGYFTGRPVSATEFADYYLRR